MTNTHVRARTVTDGWRALCSTHPRHDGVDHCFVRGVLRTRVSDDVGGEGHCVPHALQVRGERGTACFSCAAASDHMASKPRPPYTSDGASCSGDGESSGRTCANDPRAHGQQFRLASILSAACQLTPPLQRRGRERVEGRRGMTHSFVPPTRETERRSSSHRGGCRRVEGRAERRVERLVSTSVEHIQRAATWTVREVRRASNTE
jgi:hypothetical protein